MSYPAGSISSHRAVEIYSIALNFAQRSSRPSVQQSRVADAVQRSKESLNKADYRASDKDFIFGAEGEISSQDK